jgi:hypothetical protein
VNNSVRHAIDLSNGQFTDEGKTYISQALRKYFSDRDPIEEALGLTVAARKKFRNESLLLAADILRGNREVSNWALARDLAQAIKRFESLSPPRRRVTLSALDQLISDALSSHCEMIRSQRKLYELMD